MYIERLEDLSTLVSQRITEQREIRSRCDAWIQKAYGINRYSELTSDFFGPTVPETSLVLCRQIPSVRMEDIACEIVANTLGYPLLSPSFIDDTFSCLNHEKKSYAHPTWVGRGRTGNAFKQGQRLLDRGMAEYVGKPLSHVMTMPQIPGKTLPEFHLNLRKKVFGERGELDISELHRQYARTATRKPEFLFDFSDGIARKKTVSEEALSSTAFRPPAEWYYPLYFSWFLDGSKVLLETYDNDLAQVSQAKSLFEETVRTIEKEVGVRPLVLKIPPLDDRTLALPKRLVDSPSLLDDIGRKFSGRTTGDSVELFREIVDHVFKI